uniref:Uncharacterized protein n=1 Tax=Tetraselmis chuii TaxID=63592 RepID=A0A7S1X330_9CHLO|mmetsp:Transcript_2333/g.4124  ORF Transcript_2333/g.4124 Transcript_2333/m.4124 type:complete len:915 (+) Transcript_2333:328-3072(+)
MSGRGTTSLYGKRLPHIELDRVQHTRLNKPEPLPSRGTRGHVKLALYDGDIGAYKLTAAGESQLSVLRQLLQARHLDAVLSELGQKGGGSAMQHPALRLAELPEVLPLATAILSAFMEGVAKDAWELLAKVASSMETLQEAVAGDVAPMRRAAGALLATLQQLAALQDVPAVLLGKMPPRQLRELAGDAMDNFEEALVRMLAALQAGTAEIEEGLRNSLPEGSGGAMESLDARAQWLEAFGTYWRLQRCTDVVSRWGGRPKQQRHSIFESEPDASGQNSRAAGRPAALLRRYAALRASQLLPPPLDVDAARRLPLACTAELRQLNTVLLPGTPRWGAGCPVIFRGTVPCINLCADAAGAAAGCLPSDPLVPVSAAPITCLLGDVSLQWRSRPLTTHLQADAVEAAASREGWAEEALALTRFTYAELLTEVATRLRRERPHEAVTMGWRLLTASPAGASSFTTATEGVDSASRAWSWAVAVVEVTAGDGVPTGDSRQGNVVEGWAAKMSVFADSVKGNALALPPGLSGSFVSAPTTAALEALAVLRRGLTGDEQRRGASAFGDACVAHDMEEVLQMATATLRAAVNWAAHQPKLFPSSATLQGLCLLHSDSLQLADATASLLDSVEEQSSLGSEGRRVATADGVTLAACDDAGRMYGPGTSVDTAGAGFRAALSSADDRGTGETRTQGGACWRAGTPSTSLRPVPAEAALLSTLRQQFSALQLRVGALTDMLAEEFREAARGIWTNFPVAGWDVGLGPTAPSEGAKTVARQLLQPLQSALCVLDRRSADTLFPAAVSAAVHAELQAVAEGMAGSKRLASSRITGQQLQVDAQMVWQSFMTGEAAARGREGCIEQGKEMSKELTLDASALDRAAPVFKRLNLVAELLMAPVAALKDEGAAWRRLPDSDKWLHLRKG